jgi:hypothetical protein
MVCNPLSHRYSLNWKIDLSIYMNLRRIAALRTARPAIFGRQIQPEPPDLSGEISSSELAHAVRWNLPISPTVPTVTILNFIWERALKVRPVLHWMRGGQLSVRTGIPSVCNAGEQGHAGE